MVFVQGYIADVDTGRDDTVLEAALLGTGAFSDRDLRKAKKIQSKKGLTLSSVLLEMGVVAEEVIVEAGQQQFSTNVKLIKTTAKPNGTQREGRPPHQNLPRRAQREPADRVFPVVGPVAVSE